MCIRDRVTGAAGIMDPPGYDLRMIFTIDTICTPSPSRATAVSYTHLRAHETVLDLVCRLLLEKKKAQKYQLSLSHIIVDNII